jgi:hypothetical protein
MTLNGNGATIERSTVDSTPPFRLLHVAATGDLTVQNLTLRGGSTSAALNLLFPSNAGGGLLSRGTLTLTQSTISGNNAFVGGGLATVGSTLTCFASTLSDNNASEGGGLAALDSTVTVMNSTISGNRACGGGGLTTLDSTVTVVNSTVSGNLAIIGGGILHDGTVTLTNTILANHAERDGNCATYTPHSAGHNLASAVSCRLTGPGDQQGLDPLLGPLADNDGPTATDQRGVSRPKVGAANGTANCDIGAFEVTVPLAAVH